MEVAKTNFSELIALSREAIADMRLLIFQLRPPALEEVGLVAALKNLLDTVESKAGIQVVFHAEGELPFSAKDEDELYGIAQEALNNVIKHAHANQVKAKLMHETGCLRLTIEENGFGFDPEKPGPSRGQGIHNIRERRRLMPDVGSNRRLARART